MKIAVISCPGTKIEHAPDDTIAIADLPYFKVHTAMRLLGPNSLSSNQSAPDSSYITKIIPIPLSVGHFKRLKVGRTLTPRLLALVVGLNISTGICRLNSGQMS